ncbi:exodeoxyribonuclease V subunit alpha [Buchnera aphidicola (Kurisakia onigurumii)]|uniref:exodeoxyribonuclease V subunit alpha n=1 Tax=Buchnera aphidicola TaxID=9 RepID=UPI0031B6C5F1
MKIKIKKLLQDAAKNKIINLFDFYFSTILFDQYEVEIIFIAACISYYYNIGNIYLPISVIEKKKVFLHQKKYNNIIKKIWKCVDKVKDWNKYLNNHKLFKKKSILFPIIIVDNNIYLKKVWEQKEYIKKYFLKKKKDFKINLNKTKKILDIMFKTKIDKYQKISIVLSLIKKITFIIGGPGTGKTTTVLKILLAIIRIKNHKNIKIKLCAPTGKASFKLIESINNSIKKTNVSKKEKKILPKSSNTIHSFILKYKKKKYLNKKIDFDVLIIDESSMIDINIMYELIKLIPINSRIIFLGDYNQLPSVQSGSILKDICKNFDNTYDIFTAKKINFLIQEKVCVTQKKYLNIKNNICILKKNYRFSRKSNIHNFSTWIIEKNMILIKNILKNKMNEIHYFNFKNIDKYFLLLRKMSKNFNTYWISVIKNNKIMEIFENFNKFRILCVINEGIFGVKFINEYLDKLMFNKYHKKLFFNKNNKKEFVGKVIQITKNNKILNIFNGEIGIFLLDKKNKIKIFFLSQENKFKKINPQIIHDYQSAWCTTVHKSQGSEFDNIFLIFPNKYIHSLNNQLIYTAITRAKKNIYILSKKKIIYKSIQNEYSRKSIIFL